MAVRVQQQGLAAQARRTASALGRFARAKPLGMAGVFTITCLIIMALSAPIAAPYNPKDITFDRVLPPNSTNLLGTDTLGRDILSRVLHGARVSLYVGIVSVFIGISLGTALGILSGYIGGIFDLIFQRFIDALAAFPNIILALALIAARGQSIGNLIIVIAVLMVPGAVRIIRGVTLSVKEMVFVDSARAVGATNIRIMARHILPNCIAPYLILISVNVGFAIIVEASLSFLGAGAPPEEPTWGSMVNEAAKNFFSGSLGLTITPGAMITLTVLSFNLLGDALRDTLDPRLRGTT